MALPLAVGPRSKPLQIHSPYSYFPAFGFTWSRGLLTPSGFHLVRGGLFFSQRPYMVVCVRLPKVTILPYKVSKLEAEKLTVSN